MAYLEPSWVGRGVTRNFVGNDTAFNFEIERNEVAQSIWIRRALMLHP